MAESPDDTKSNTESDLGYTQALKYGRDLARLYALEKAKRRDLELAHQKLQVLFETTPNGMAVLDERMVILEINPGFEALVERSDNCVGHSLMDVLSCDDLIVALESLSDDGEPFVEVEVKLAKPKDRTLHVIAAPLSAGDQRGWVISLHDITERKRLEKLKEEFISIAAHELRTPLAVILGFADVLLEELEDSEDTLTVTAVDHIHKAGTRLRLVIDEMIGFADARSRATGEIGGELFDLWEVIHRKLDTVRHEADLKGIEIEVEAADEPLEVYGDRVIISQAIGHLLDNAIKFNRSGGQVCVRASQGDDETILEIQDTGIGVPRTDLDRVFDPFYQVEGHLTRAQDGLGLGLTIAQRGVELHGGRISVESDLGAGTCFRVILPQSLEPLPMPTQTHLDTAHRQTLAFGRDLARTIAAQQALTRRLSDASAMARQLQAQLEQQPESETSEEISPFLDGVRALIHHLVDDAGSPADDAVNEASLL